MSLPLTGAGPSAAGFLPFTDDFNRANGALGTPWVSGGVTWAVASNEAVNTPTEGVELVANGAMEAPYDDESGGGGGTINVANNWNNYNCETDGSDTLDECTTVSDPGGNGVTPHGGASCQYADVDAVLEGVRTAGTPLFPTGLWYHASVWIYPVAGVVQMVSSSASLNISTSGTGAWQQIFGTGRALAAEVLFVRSGAGAAEYYVDDVSVKGLTLNTLFSNIEAGTADVVCQVELDTVVASTQAGLVLNLDDKDTPANFVIAYHNGTNAVMEKCVAGTYSSVISAAAAYVAGATIQVTKSGTDYTLTYNSAQVGATSTINDAGIVDNMLHGMFSTYSGNQLDNFSCEAN